MRRRIYALTVLAVIASGCAGTADAGESGSTATTAAASTGTAAPTHLSNFTVGWILGGVAILIVCGAVTAIVVAAANKKTSDKRLAAVTALGATAGLILTVAVLVSALNGTSATANVPTVLASLIVGTAAGGGTAAATTSSTKKKVAKHERRLKALETKAQVTPPPEDLD